MGKKKTSVLLAPQEMAGREGTHVLLIEISYFTFLGPYYLNGMSA